MPGNKYKVNSNDITDHIPGRLERLLRERKLRKSSKDSYSNEVNDHSKESELIENDLRSKEEENAGISYKFSEASAASRAFAEGCDKQEGKPPRQRLLVVANRLPVSAVRRGEDSWSLEISAGGLVSALLGVNDFEARWIGWAGVNVPDEVGQKALTEALAEKRCIPVFLDEEIVHQYYNGYCNNILWPLFHYLGLPQEDRLATTRSFQSQFAAYKKANQMFADVVNKHYEEGDVVWCHDYHLMFLPKCLKDHNRKMKVGWFLHTPFPSSEIHRTLPSRSELLRSVLAADLVGFHTYDYARHFVSACTRILGLEGTPEGVEDQGKLTRVAAFPIGIDSDRFIRALKTSEVQVRIEELKDRFKGRKSQVRSTRGRVIIFFSKTKMAVVGFSFFTPLLPIFNGEKYEWWSIKMKTLLRSQELWDLVEYGFVDISEPTIEEKETLSETKKNDVNALFIIQQAVHETIFSRIAAATTSKQAWSILQEEFQGDSKVITVKFQSLRRDFETLLMMNGESIADFLSRTMAIVSQMRTYGEKISDETIVAKVLRSLTPNFDHVVTTIEEATKDLSILSVDKLMGLLQAHESRINKSSERNIEKALQVETTNNEGNERENIEKALQVETGNNEGNEKENVCLASRSCGREGFRSFHGDHDNRGRWRSDGQRQFNKQRNVIQCYHCRRYGHTKSNCWYKNQRMNFAAENEEEEEKLLMACMDTNPRKGDLWFVDSGCSNHMTGIKSLFKELDETQKIKVQLGNTKEMQVEGKDTVNVKTSHGKIKLFDSDRKEITVEVSTDEETRVNSSASPGSTATQSVSNSSSSASLNSNSSLEQLSDETPPRKYKSLADIYASCQFALTISDPMNYEEATEKEDGKKAMAVEMQSFKKDETWDMVDLPNEKFYGDLQEEVYVTPLEGFIKEDKETKVYKLRQTLYGLKQTYLRRPCQKKSSVLTSATLNHGGVLRYDSKYSK